MRYKWDSLLDKIDPESAQHISNASTYTCNHLGFGETKEQQDYKGAIVLFSLTIHLRSEKPPDSSAVMSLTQIREDLPVLCQST